MALFGGGSRSTGRGSGRGGGSVLGRGNDDDDDPYNYNISTASKASKGKEGSTGTPTRAGGKVGGATPSSEDVLGKAAAYLKKYSPGQQQPQAQQRTPNRAYELNSDDDSMDSMDSFKDQRSGGAVKGRGAGGRETGGGGSYGSPVRTDERPDLSPRKADPFSQTVKFDSNAGGGINFLGITGVDIPATRSTAGYPTTSSADDRRTAATPASRPPIVMPPSSYDTNVSAFSRPFRPGSDRLDDDDDASYHDAHHSDDSDDDNSSSRRSAPSPPSAAAQAGGSKKFLTIDDLSSILADPSDPPTVVPDPIPSAYRPALTSNLSTVMEDAIRSEDEANDLRRTPDSVEEEEHVATKPTPAARVSALSPVSDAYASDFDDALDSPAKTTHPTPQPPTVYAAPAPAPQPIVQATAAPVAAPPPPPPVTFVKPQPPPAKRADEATHAVQTVLRPPSSLPAPTATHAATTTTAQAPVEGAVAVRPRVSIVYDLDSRQLDKVDQATQCSGNEATVQATVIPSSMLSALPHSSRSSLLHRKGPLSAHPRLYPPSNFKLNGSKALRHMMLASAAAYPETYISLATLLPPPPPPPSMAQSAGGPIASSMGEASMGSENRRGAQNVKAARQEADDGSVASQQLKPSEGPTAPKAKAKTATTGTSMEDGEDEKREVRSKGKGGKEEAEEGHEEGGGREEHEPARTPTRKGGKSRAHRGPPDGCGHVPYPCYHPHYYPPMPYGYPPSAPAWGPGPTGAPGLRPSDVLANCFTSLQQQDHAYKAMHAQLDNIAALGRGGDGKRVASTSGAPATKARQPSRAARHEEESQATEDEDDDGYSQASDDFEPDSEDEGPSQASHRSSHRQQHKARPQQAPPRGARLADSGSNDADTCGSGYYNDAAGMLGEGLEDSVMSTRALYRQQLNVLRHQLRQMRLHAQYAGVRQTSY